MKSRTFHFFVLLVIVACTFLVNNNVLEPNIMESRNLVTAREMLEKGNWLYPTMNGEQRLEKPPLPTWAAAGMMAIAGQDNLALLRLPAVLAGMLLIFFLYKFTEEISNDKELPVLVAGTAASSFYILFMARDISWDIFCHSFMMGGVWLLHRALKNDSWKMFAGAGVLMGLSGLSKGPVSFYALLLPYLLSRGFVYGWRNFSGHKIKIAGMVLIALIIGFWWPLLTFLLDSHTSLQVAQKESSAWISHNIRPFYRYWSFPVQSGIWTFVAVVALVFPYAQKRINRVTDYRLIAVWVWFSVLLLSLFPEKKERYLLPVLLPLAILTAASFRYLILVFKEKIQTRSDMIVFRINAAILAITCTLIPSLLYYYFKGKIEPSGLMLIFLSFIFFSFAIWFIRAAMRNQPFHVWCGTVALMMMAGLLMPVISKVLKTNPEYHSYQELRHHAGLQHLPFFFNGEVGGKFIEVVWSSGREISHWDPSTSPVLPVNPPFVLLTHEDPEKILPPEILSKYQLERIGHYDKNLQKGKSQDVLENYVSVIRKK